MIHEITKDFYHADYGVLEAGTKADLDISESHAKELVAGGFIKKAEVNRVTVLEEGYKELKGPVVTKELKTGKDTK